MKANPLNVVALVFPGFELLDLFGPLELFGALKGDAKLTLVAEKPGAVASSQGPQTLAETGFEMSESCDVLLIPGGMGTRREVNNTAVMEWLQGMAARSRYVASVCTGAALLAKAGVLDGRRATSNKLAFEWVTSQGPSVNWIARARWVEDGNYFTSSGVSAGMDMTLALIERILGRETTLMVARYAEYIWNEDPAHDPFAQDG